MRAVRYLGLGRSEVVDVPMPALSPGKVLVRVLASAVCGSERQDYMREIPADQTWISGHEAVGEVADANGSARWKVGDRVCVQIMNGCGRCPYCRAGMPTFCPELQYENSCHAQYTVMPESCLVPMAADIPPEIAVLLGGDLLGVARRATRQLPIHEGTQVYVSGGGPIGLGVIFMLKALGARVILSEPHDYRRAFAVQKAGADVALNPLAEDVHAILMSMTEGIGPEITIECSGNPIAQNQALSWTRCQGHVMFCGENYKGLDIVPSLQIIHKELNVHGAFYFTASDVPELIDMYRKGMNPRPLVSHVVPIEDAPAAIEAFFEGKTGKVVLLPNG